MHGRGPWRVGRSAAPVVALSVALLACQASGECAECQKEKCADLLSICARNMDCACMGKCVADRGIPGVELCLERCALTSRPAGFAELESCMAVACPDSDECATPSGYEPQDAATSPDAAVPPMPDAIGSGALADCDFDPALSFDGDRGELLQLQSADGRVCVRLERRNEGRGSLANTRWTLLDMRVGPLGQVAAIEDPGALCWYSSHHNFKDWAHGWSGDVHYDVELAEDGHGGARTFTLHAFEGGPLLAGACAPTEDGTTPIGGPIELFAVQP